MENKIDKSKKHITHIYWGMTYGGIETMLVNIMNIQYEAGAQVSLVIVNDYYEKELLKLINPSIKVHFIGRKVGSYNLSFIKKINQVLDEIHPTTIHLHSSKLYPALNKKYKKISIVTLHNVPFGKIRKFGLISKIFPFIDIFGWGNVSNIDKIGKVYAISKIVKSQLKDLYSVESNLIYNGIKTSDILSKSAFDTAETPKVLRVVQIGRLDIGHKGQDLSIECVARLKGRIQLDIIGDGKDYETLLAMANQKCQKGSVNFLGKKSQEFIASHLKDYDLAVQPSRLEGFGLTVSEAMVAGVPILISANDGPLEITEEERYGWTFENGNVESMVSKIEYILDNYPLVLKKAESARQHVLDNFDVKTTAMKYLNEC